MLFLKFLVRDLGAARAFYEGLGFRVQEPSSDETQVALVVDDDIALVLLPPDRFADLTAPSSAGPAGPAGPEGRTTVVPSLSFQRRGDVDDLLARAVSAGGRQLRAPQEDGTAYTGIFADPDGHVWEAVSLDQLHVIN